MADGVPKSVMGRTFAILGSFNSENRRMTLSVISERTGLPVSSVHRMVAELVYEGALTRNLDGSYEIGTRIWRLGVLASLHSDLRELALPYMEDVYLLRNDAVQIGVLDGLRCLIAERIAGSRTLSVISKPGARLPLHASGVGKVLLAHGSADLQAAAFEVLEKYTERTITNPDLLKRQLLEVKSLGFAFSKEELAVGATSLAVPVFGVGGKVTAALGIVTPVQNREIEKYVSVLKISATALSRKLQANNVGHWG